MAHVNGALLVDVCSQCSIAVFLLICCGEERFFIIRHEPGFSAGVNSSGTILRNTSRRDTLCPMFFNSRVHGAAKIHASF